MSCKIRTELHVYLSVLINSCFLQNGIHHSLLQQKHLMSLLRGLWIGMNQLNHL